MDNESEYEKFVISENQVSTPDVDSTFDQNLASQSVKKASSQAISEIEKNKITRLIVRRLLSQSPFSTKYEDIRIIVKQYLPELTNYSVLNSFIDHVRSVMNKIFGLNLEDVKYSQGRRDLYLKQTISFKPHDLKTLTQGDHEIRGFMLLLIPCFKAYNNTITLKCLCEIFEKIGKTNMIPKCKEDEESLILKLKTIKRKKDVKYYSKDFTYISDYLLYAKDLSYIYIIFQDQALDLLSSVIISPGYRLTIEYDKQQFVNTFKELDENSFNRGLNIFFE